MCAWVLFNLEINKVILMRKPKSMRAILRNDIVFYLKPKHRKHSPCIPTGHNSSGICTSSTGFSCIHSLQVCTLTQNNRTSYFTSSMEKFVNNHCVSVQGTQNTWEHYTTFALSLRLCRCLLPSLTVNSQCIQTYCTSIFHTLLFN